VLLCVLLVTIFLTLTITPATASSILPQISLNEQKTFILVFDKIPFNVKTLIGLKGGKIKKILKGAGVIIVKAPLKAKSLLS